MDRYVDAIISSYYGYADYLWRDITSPQWTSYFYLLITVSTVFFVLEVLIPWRRGQSIFRKDFFLDVFYMFFNFFLFYLIAYNAASTVVVTLLNDTVKEFFGGFDLQAFNPIYTWPLWTVLLLGFFVRDFIQWGVHRLMHRLEPLWKFHQVHHSVREMGFAAHLRFHWMEIVLYRSIEYIPLALLGIGLYDFFVIHLVGLAWGHYNHANFRLPNWLTGGIVGGLIGLAIGSGSFEISLIDDPTNFTALAGLAGGVAAGGLVLAPLMPYLFNSPEMHLWHHARHLPDETRHGVNFGLTLAIWDYLFGTNYQPRNQADLELGFPGMETFPKDFVGQATTGFNLTRFPSQCD
ncbi:hypothetical protein LEM8419_03449 [Neolewinella maritima]|uniref:Fatty acid hydroxylase domain-containing protein n=1 Tax=Neolewinella maritima TaxID=1383882 RepID=A0ABN8F6J6_9BACT|nr:sterol desaturase family protein [Neolewinella maritima]CAH1002575.1 hypothetical protein LEM8419_03449 [Neolewinella maritima]